MSGTERSYEGQTFKADAVAALVFRGREFTGCVFKGCDLSGLKLSGALFIDCRFTDCNLSNVRVDGCSFRRVTFDGCKLIGVVFGAVNPFLLDWCFQKCKIELCDFSGMKMKRSRFLECVIHKTDLINADLSEADLSGSDFEGSRFHHTVLEKANFTGATRYYIDPANNRIRQAAFSHPEVLSLLASFEIRIDA